MLRSTQQSLNLVHGTFLVLFATLLAPVMGAQTPCENIYGTAMRLLHVFYPELKGKQVLMNVVARPVFDSDSLPPDFEIAVSELHPSEPIRGSAPYTNPSSADVVGHLSTHFEFDRRDNGIHLVFASGTYVNDEKQQTLTKLVDEHPEWSAVQMTETLSASGAKFGSNQKEALLARFPVNDLEPILGKIKITSVYFRFRQNNEPRSGGVMLWSILFRATKGEKHDEYTASLEPFDGKIISLGRRALN
jgi:hypothetical protein